MKKYLLLGLVIVALLAMTSAAFAGGYATWTPGGPNGTSPHNGYTDSSTKCKVCHAVHNATSGGEALLRSTRNLACVYCHVNPGTVSSKNPYGTGAGGETNYTGVSRAANQPGPYNHAATHYEVNPRGAPFKGCVSCHSVHGANTINSGTDILKNDPGLVGGGARPVITSGTAQEQIIEFCRDCHNATGGNTTAGTGCFDSTCHAASGSTATGISTEYYLQTRDGVSHVMTTNMSNPAGDKKVAWTTDPYCWSCHQKGYGAATYSFPHYTSPAVQFLFDEYSTEDTKMDVVCLKCHVEGGYVAGYTTGVGKTF